MGAGRRPAEAPLRPDPEPRRDGQGLRRPRAGDVRGRHAARTRAQAAQGPAEQGAAEGILGQALGRLFAVAEAYPELQADENFRQLQDELAQTENRIAVSRQVYNDTVLTYNNAIQTVPGVFVAGPFGFSKKDFFEVEERGPGGATRRVLAVAASRRGARARRGRRREVVRRCRRADVVVQVASDGASSSTSVITFAFDGDFSGAFREIPLRDGETTRPDRRLGGRRRATAPAPAPSSAAPARPAPSARRGPTRACGSSGTTARVGRAAHVPRPLPAARARRRLRRRRRRQPQGLGRRVGGRLGAADGAQLLAPGRASRAPGAIPVAVRGDVTLDGRRAILRALDVPAGQFVELRALVPRRFFTSTAGMQVERGPGLDGSSPRSATTRQRTSATGARSTTRSTTCRGRSRSCSRSRLGPALALLGVRLVALRPRARDGYDREYEQEPPTETQPALVPPLLAPGRDAGLARVHRDAVRPDPPRALPRRAGDDRAEDLGRAQDAARRRPRALARRRRGAGRGVRGARRARSSTRSSPTGPERLSRFRDRIEDDRTANSERFTALQVGRRRGDLGSKVVPATRGSSSLARRRGRARRRRRDHALRRHRRLRLGRADAGAASSRSRSASAGSSDAAALVDRGAQPAPLAAPLPGRAGGGRALGGVPPLPDRLPPPRRGAAGDARALGALPRLRDRVRDRRARAPGRAAAHARGARAGELALLDRPARRPRLRRDLDEHRRPGRRLRLGARAALVRLGRLRRRLLAAAAAEAAAGAAAAPGEAPRRPSSADSDLRGRARRARSRRPRRR